MIEIKIVGRGGQGAVTAAYLLAKACFYDGFYTQAFPMFGIEKRGSPVESYVRIDKKPIKKYYQIKEPDYIITLDSSIETKEIKKTVIIQNSSKISKNLKITSFDARKIAQRIFSKPLYNTIMIGAFAKITKITSLNSLLKASQETWEGEMLKKNMEAIKEAWNLAKQQ